MTNWRISYQGTFRNILTTFKEHISSLLLHVLPYLIRDLVAYPTPVTSPFSELAIINKCHTGNGTLKTMTSSTSFIQHDWANTAEGRDMMSCLFTRNKQRLRTFGKPY